MKTSNIFAVAALSFAALTGAVHAEEYQGVQAPVSALSRAEVQQQALAKAHSANQNIPALAVSQGALDNARDRAAVRAEAVAAAHDSTQNLEAGSFAASQIPANLQNNTAVRSQAAL